MDKLIVLPPVAFIVVLVATLVLSRLLSRLSYKLGKRTTGEGKAYACGEKDYDHMAQPDYSNFFPFAFFFTLAHVATLIMTTVPVESRGTLIMAAIYIVGSVISLYILFRK